MKKNGELICPDCGVSHGAEACPKCGRKLYYGFGLAGGGYGPYKTCDCGYFEKQVSKTDEQEIQQ